MTLVMTRAALVPGRKIVFIDPDLICWKYTVFIRLGLIGKATPVPPRNGQACDYLPEASPESPF